jgi:hypothetical protein
MARHGSRFCAGHDLTECKRKKIYEEPSIEKKCDLYALAVDLGRFGGCGRCDLAISLLEASTAKSLQKPSLKARNNAFLGLGSHNSSDRSNLASTKLRPVKASPFLRLTMHMGAHFRMVSSFMSPVSGSCRGIRGWHRICNNTVLALPAASSFGSITNRKLHSVHTGSRPQPAYPGHIPLSPFENTLLAVGSALMSLIDTRRAGGGFLAFYVVYMRG